MATSDDPARSASAAGRGERIAAHGWAWWATWAGVVVGGLGLVGVIAGIGTDRLVRLATSAWPVVALGIVLELGATLLRARALHVFLRPSQRMISYPRIVIAQAAGSAMADVTPTGVLGDATKLTVMLGRVPASAAVSAILTYDVVALQLGAYVILVGTFVVAVWGELPPALASALWATAALQLVVLAGFAWAIRRGLTRTAIGVLAALHVVSRARRQRWIARVAEVDGRLEELQSRRAGERAQGLALLLGGRLLSWLELLALLHVVGIHPGPALLATIVLGQLPISRLSSVIPFGMGARDAGVAGLFVVLGLPAASGASIVLLLRVRQVATVLIGLGSLSLLQAIDRVSAARRRTRLVRRMRHEAC